jgi:semaphorin 6
LALQHCNSNFIFFQVPSPRPGSCSNDTKSLPDANLNFIKTHSLMDESVSPFFGAPIVIRFKGSLHSQTLLSDPTRHDTI